MFNSAHLEHKQAKLNKDNSIVLENYLLNPSLRKKFIFVLNVHCLLLYVPQQ